MLRALLLLLTLFITGNMKLILEKRYEDTYKVKCNDKTLGEFYREIDGFFYYVPESKYGSYSESFLQALLFELQKLNAPCKEHIREYFENEHKVN